VVDQDLTSQRSPELWHDHIGDPAIADAICARAAQWRG